MAPERARKLRSNPTEAETRLWSRLRRRQVDGFRFRRQQPIGPFIVDFFCPEAKLIIEVDGGQHTDNARREAVRTRWLEKAGCRIIHFWNHDVLANTDGDLEVIRGLLRS